MISDLVDSARMLHGELEIEPRPSDLGLVVERALASARSCARARGVAIDLRLDARSRPVRIDEQRLQRALTHLLLEAVRASAPGGTLPIWTYFSPEFAEIGVRNAGAGVPQDLLPRALSEPMQTQALETIEAMGLGMVLAKQLVELQGGQLAVRSARRGSPASLAIRLPGRLYSSFADAGPKINDDSPAAPGARLDGVHIMLVEDDPDAIEFLALVLRSVGARVSAFTASAPAYALYVSAPSEERPDVVVSDIAMPVEDGYSLLARIRAWEASTGTVPVPAIAVTAFAREEDRRRALASGFDRHIGKPLDAARLIENIAQWI